MSLFGRISSHFLKLASQVTIRNCQNNAFIRNIKFRYTTQCVIFPYSVSIVYMYVALEDQHHFVLVHFCLQLSQSLTDLTRTDDLPDAFTGNEITRTRIKSASNQTSRMSSNEIAHSQSKVFVVYLLHLNHHIMYYGDCLCKLMYACCSSCCISHWLCTEKSQFLCYLSHWKQKTNFQMA